jgi:hypothetical protein
VATVDGSGSAGILATTYFDAGTSVSAKWDTITDCSVGVAVGYDEFDATYAQDISPNWLEGNEYAIANSSTTNIVNAPVNWYGGVDPAFVAGKVTDGVDYSPWLASGVEVYSEEPEICYAPDLSVLWVDDDSPVYYPAYEGGVIGEAIDLVEGSTVYVAAGLYEAQIEIDKPLTLIGAGAETTTIRSPVALPLHFTTGTYENYPIVYVHDAAPVVISDLTVDGYGRGNANFRFSGIAYYNAGGSVEDCPIIDVRDEPLSGRQHGVGLYVYAPDSPARTLAVSNCTLSGYQKNGMAFLGAQLTASVEGCTVTGGGPLGTGLPAQNGIEFATGASGSITDCRVEDHLYTGGSWASTGFLFLDAGGTISVVDCTAEDNVPSFYCQDSNVDISGTECRHAHADAGDGLYVYNSTSSFRGQSEILQPSPIDAGSAQDKDDRGAFGVTVDQCLFDGHDATYSWGLGAFSTGTQVAGLTVTNSIVTNWDSGIVLYYDSEYGYTGPVDVSVSGSTVADNAAYGVENLSTAAYVDAEGNWWGDATGPLDNSDDTGTGGLYNPGGLGNEVTDYVDYEPWLGGNIVCVPDPQQITVTDADAKDWVTVHYLGGLSGPLFGYSLRLDFPSEIDILQVLKPLSGPFATAVPFQAIDQGSNWIVDAGLGGSNPGTLGPCDLCRVQVQGLSCSSAGAVLGLTVEYVRDPDNQPLTGAVADDGLVQVDLGVPTITASSLVRTNLPDNGYVKDGDRMLLTATIQDACSGVEIGGIIADLSSLGGGTEVAPVSYDTGTGLATWVLLTVSGSPDGTKTVSITVADVLGNEATLDPAGSVYLDNTLPPLPVTDLTASPGHNQISLSWTNPTGDPDLETYGIMIRRVGWGDYPEYDLPEPSYPDTVTGTR